MALKRGVCFVTMGTIKKPSVKTVLVDEDHGNRSQQEW
jgi:hypothetical protein